MKTHPVLGGLEVDPVGHMLHTGYDRFASAIGICGLAKVTSGRLDLLAVVTDTPGLGQFRTFVNECKQHYESIYVWHVDNLVLEQALRRYGFLPTVQVDGEVVRGWRWDKERNER